MVQSKAGHQKLPLPQGAQPHLDLEARDVEQGLAALLVPDPDIRGVQPTGERKDAEAVNPHPGVQGGGQFPLGDPVNGGLKRDAQPHQCEKGQGQDPSAPPPQAPSAHRISR